MTPEALCRPVLGPAGLKHGRVDLVREVVAELSLERHQHGRTGYIRDEPQSFRPLAVELNPFGAHPRGELFRAGLPLTRFGSERVKVNRVLQRLEPSFDIRREVTVHCSGPRLRIDAWPFNSWEPEADRRPRSTRLCFSHACPRDAPSVEVQVARFPRAAVTRIWSA